MKIEIKKIKRNKYKFLIEGDDGQTGFNFVEQCSKRDAEYLMKGMLLGVESEIFRGVSVPDVKDEKKELIGDELAPSGEHLRILLRKFADVLIQIRKDTNNNGDTGLKAIEWTHQKLHELIEQFVSIEQEQTK